MIRVFLVLSVISMFLVAGENLLVNGDFELSKTPKDFKGYDYVPPAKAKYLEIDSEVKHSGKASLKISGASDTWVALIQKSRKLEDFNKPILIRGWAKYENLVSRLPEGKLAGMPFVGLWSNTAKGTNGPSFGIGGFAEGSKDWFQFQKVFDPISIKKRLSVLKGDRMVSSIAFRINISSQSGTVWFDDLEMTELDNEKLTANLPLRDISGRSLKVKLVVDASIQGEAEATLKCNNISRTYPLKQGENLVTFHLKGIVSGDHTLSVLPGKGFPAETKAIELKFSIVEDAFGDEQL